MNEKDLGKALLQGEHPVNVDELTRQVLKRDRRRVFWLAVASVMTWMLVVALPWSTLLPMVAMLAGQFADDGGELPTTMASAADNHERSMLMLQILKKGITATFLGSMISMFIAAICTVSLIVVSRRATLRQMNVRLGEISDQLKALANKPG